MGSRLDDPSNESEDLPSSDDQFTSVLNSLIMALTAQPAAIDGNEDYRYINESSREKVLEEIYSDPNVAEDAFYLFNIGKLRSTVRLFLEIFLPNDPHRRVAYAVKANPHREILRILIEEGVNCMDCASLGEIRRVSCFDFDPGIIVDWYCDLTASAVDLVIPIIANEYRDGLQTIYLPDGIFGSFTDHAVYGCPCNFITLKKSGRIASSSNLASYRIYGPSCDSGDRLSDIQSSIKLPRGVAVGDKLIIENMGLRAHNISSQFGDMDIPAVVLYNDV